jgi:hypothetical protein
VTARPSRYGPVGSAGYVVLATLEREGALSTHELVGACVAAGVSYMAARAKLYDAAAWGYTESERPVDGGSYTWYLTDTGRAQLAYQRDRHAGGAE